MYLNVLSLGTLMKPNAATTIKILKHFKNDIKNTWKTINDTLGRHKKESKMPNSMVYKNDTVSDP